MKKPGSSPLFLSLVLSLASSIYEPSRAQSAAGQSSSEGSAAVHQIEGRVQHRTGHVSRIRVRLVRLPEMRPVGETFTRPEGQFNFGSLIEGTYAVETFETEKYLATTTEVIVRPLSRNRPTTINVLVELPPRPPDPRTAPGVVMADVDVKVPGEAQKRFRAGIKALREGESDAGIAELKAAVEIHPTFYSARLELGKELRQRRDFSGAEAALRPLLEIAPRRPDPRVELGAVLLSLDRRKEAIGELETALRLREENWAAHLYLGWALLETDGSSAETHLNRAIELDEKRAARAHLALGRLAHERGRRELAVKHLEAYVALAPDATDAENARRLANSLRTPK